MISSAPISTSSSMMFAILSFSTILLTATQSFDSKGLIVGAFLPGVILVASDRLVRQMLYWQTTYFLAATTPAIRFVMTPIRGDRVGCFMTFDLMRTASDRRTVATACRPAARIVSPDSGGTISTPWDASALSLLTNKVDCIPSRQECRNRLMPTGK